jgi:hypothetical protein
MERESLQKIAPDQRRVEPVRRGDQTNRRYFGLIKFALRG